MQLKNGSPNLLDVTRRLAGDKRREAEGGTLYSDAEVVDEINLAYDEVWRFGKAEDQGWDSEIQYRDSTTGQIWYGLPSDLDNEIVTISIEPDGKDLSSDSTAVPKLLKKGTFEREFFEYQNGQVTESLFWIPRKTASDVLQYGIIKPPSTGGSSAIQIVLKTETVLLSGDADETMVSRSGQQLICLVAAEGLRLGMDMDIGDLQSKMGRLFPSYIEDVGDRSWTEPDFQPRCAGLTRRQNFETRHGFSTGRN